MGLLPEQETVATNGVIEVAVMPTALVTWNSLPDDLKCHILFFLPTNNQKLGLRFVAKSWEKLLSTPEAHNLQHDEWISVENEEGERRWPQLDILKGARALTLHQHQTLPNLPSTLEQLDIYLGRSKCGRDKVLRAVLNEVEEVAVKRIRIDRGRQQSLLEAEKEVGLLRDCMSHYVVRFLGAVVDEEQIMVVTEFCPGGDLWHALKNDHAGEFRWYKRGRQIALDIASGLHYLHEMRRIIHFDLKSPNVLLDRNGSAKIGDVGLSKILRDTTVATIANAIGTMMWASPEQLMGQDCDYKADIWSLGVILWEICTGGEAPRQSRFLRELRVPEECPADIAELSYACRHPDPGQRPTALEVFRAMGGGLMVPQ